MFENYTSKLRKPNLLRRIFRRILLYFFFEQWFLLLAQNNTDKEPSWKDFTRFIPPPDRIWADPFIWVHGDKYYVFFEEQPTDTKPGHICCMTLDDDLKILANEIVLKRSYHLSYPFIFEHDGELYMLPETGMNRSVEVYRCKKFPNRWVLVQTLLSGLYAFDATLFENKGKWWLFVNIGENEGGESTWDKLHLFYSDHPLSRHWTPHLANPIIQDVRSARPAGRIFLQNGEIIRPSQDCSKRYGYATNFNIITKLSETEYEESLGWKFLPTSKDILSTHTWNRVDNLLAVDAMLRRQYSGGIRRIGKDFRRFFLYISDKWGSEFP